MKSPLFRKKKNPAGEFESIINKHFDFFPVFRLPYLLPESSQKIFRF